MLLVGFRGAEPAPEMPILRQVAELNLGGVILFDRDAALGIPGRNIESPQQLARLTTALKDAALGAGIPPLFIAVDQEGGRVQRLKPANGFPDFPAAADLCPGGDPRPAEAAGQGIGQVLAHAGINLNFAPVCDVDANPDNPVIGRLGRSFSSNPDAVAACAGGFARGLKSQGVLAVAKHFPGHGSSAADTHLGVADISATWTQAELGPFLALADAGLADMVMTAHVMHLRLDPDLPASLSPLVTGNLLRRQMGYRGVVVTDDLQMRAVTDHFGFKRALGLAVNAGADILLIGNNLEYDEQVAPKALDALMELVAEGTVSPRRIRESCRRIQALKLSGLTGPRR